MTTPSRMIQREAKAFSPRRDEEHEGRKEGRKGRVQASQPLSRFLPLLPSLASFSLPFFVLFVSSWLQ
jgi:hypothetical protein